MRTDALPTAQLNKMLLDWIAAEVGGCLICLHSTVITPDQTIQLSDLVELDPAVYTWYARAALAPGLPYDTEDGSDSMNITWASKQWNYSGAVPPVTVRGYMLVTHVAGPPAVDTLISVGMLVAPILMGAVLDAVIVQPQLHIPSIPYLAA
jgi:hypothetical protein